VKANLVGALTEACEPQVAYGFSRLARLLKRWLAVGVAAIGLIFLISASTSAENRSPAGTVTINLARGPIARFLPDETFGAALDGHQNGELARIYTAGNIKKMEEAGLRRISYRLRTELGVEAWHWSERGTWSDGAHKQGYWTSSDSLDQRVLISHGYNLPRRGDTIDQANDNGYSRLSDGDDATFWKSNPYLDEYYTHEPNALHPQWVVIDLGKMRAIDAAKIDWAEPFATHFIIQYWLSAVSDFEITDEGEWRSFSEGLVSDGRGGSALLRLSDAPIDTRYVRVLLLDSSEAAPPGSADIRDRLGFAIREISLGTIDNARTFHDVMRHAPSNKTQTVVFTSSTDPWHRSIDLDADTEQPGFDLVFDSGLTNGLPVLLPVGLLYDTPENAAAEVSFLKKRGYPVRQIEMGEEPDGQRVSPEHEGALYLQFATAIHRVDPTIALGGPSFQSGIVYSGFDVDPSRPWVTRFIDYLRTHGRLSDFSFVSFEWYPFDQLCEGRSQQLLDQPQLLARAVQTLREEGVPTSIPWLIGEYGYSAFAGRTMVELPSALLNADIVGQFLTLGGKAAYLFGYEPSRPIHEGKRCAGYGQMMLHEADIKGQAQWRMPTFYAARLLTREWAEPVNQPHELYATQSDIRDPKGREIVTAYAVRRPDRDWAVLLINKDPVRVHRAVLEFRSLTGLHPVSSQGQLEIFQYSSAQYTWVAAGLRGHPARSEPPRHFTLTSTNEIALPPFSLIVVRALTAIAQTPIDVRQTVSRTALSH
jgi:F5/8 type C domain